MTETIHQRLNGKWLSQRQKYSEWDRLLQVSGRQLKAKLAEALGVSGLTWVEAETKKKREYVELASLDVDSNSVVNSLRSEETTDNGELPFGLLVTFEHDPRSYPKVSYKLPVVIRVKQGAVQYSFWDTLEDRAEDSASWLDDPQKMVEALIDRLDTNFEFDPLAGAPAKMKIGFIQDGE